MPKQRKSVDLATPTEALVRRYLKDYESDERYSRADQAITKLFDLLPNNKRLEDVLLKLSVINGLYSTNIYAAFKMAKHIQGLDIDGELAIHSTDLVNQIAEIPGVNRRFFSFATKYCSWHDQDHYPISDSFVEKLILEYQSQHHFAEFVKADLRDYPRFKEVIEKFRGHFGLTDFRRRELDKLLWLYGKEKFGRSQIGADVD